MIIILSAPQTFTFMDSKSKHLFLNRKNPRKVAWTQAYRRLHRKGLTEEIVKKKTRKVQKVERAIVGASLEVIRQKRNQKPEMRAAAREAAER
jgi:large subunit ribosomal protein L24e